MPISLNMNIAPASLNDPEENVIFLRALVGDIETEAVSVER